MSELNTKIEKTIQLWGIKVQNNAIKVLTEEVNYPAGSSPDIVNTIETKVSVTNSGATFSLGMAGYWEYIEFGVDGWNVSHGSKFQFKKGTNPLPYKAVESFVEKRHIQPTMNIAAQSKLQSIKGRGKLSGKLRKGLKASNRDKSLRSMIFAMTKSIKREGIKPNPFRDKIITPELVNELKTSLANLYKEEIILQINLD